MPFVLLKVKAERLRQGLTQAQLGARSGLSASEVSYVENARFRPTPQQAARLARALKLKPEQLLEPDDAAIAG